jgi:hypothetical protein
MSPLHAQAEFERLHDIQCEQYHSLPNPYRYYDPFLRQQRLQAAEKILRERSNKQLSAAAEIAIKDSDDERYFHSLFCSGPSNNQLPSFPPPSHPHNTYRSREELPPFLLTHDRFAPGPSLAERVASSVRLLATSGETAS